MTSTRSNIEATFRFHEGEQVLMTSIPIIEPLPANIGDTLIIMSPSGRAEIRDLKAIEYALKPGGKEFYGLELSGELISDFEDFTGGYFAKNSK